MKKTLLLIAILAILGFIAYKMIPKKDANLPVSSMSLEDRNFAIEDVSTIGSITIQKGKEEGYLLNKRGDDWYINEKYLVSPTRMPQIFEVIKKIRVNTIPPRTALKTIDDFMEREGIKIKIYDKSNNLLKSYVIGSESSSQGGTYFRMEGYSQPYNMYIPGFVGIVRPRFLQPIDNWRDITLYRYKPEEIKEIKIDYHKSNIQSFSLKLTDGDADVQPLSITTKKIDKKPNAAKVKAYLGVYSKINIEAYDNKNIRKDTITQVLPFATITLKDTKGTVREIHYTPFIDLLDPSVQSNKIEDLIDVERYFINEKGGDFMVSQHRMIKNLFVPYTFFFED